MARTFTTPRFLMLSSFRPFFFDPAMQTGVVLRMSDRDNFMQLNTRQETIGTAVHRRRSGVNTVLSLNTIKTYTPDSWFKLRMRVVGGRITIWWNDVSCGFSCPDRIVSCTPGHESAHAVDGISKT